MNSFRQRTNRISRIIALRGLSSSFRVLNCSILCRCIALIAASPAVAADAPLVRLEQHEFGKMPDGTVVQQFTLRNAKGMTAKIITYGAIIADLEVPDRNGSVTNVVLGADSLERYTGGRGGVPGAVVLGRVANRIANATFTIDGVDYKVTANLGPHQLHGGRKGFDKVVWQAQPLPSANTTRRSSSPI